jgi:hypothetical protein
MISKQLRYNRMFERECAQICRDNFGDYADRIKLFVAGGHDHGVYTKTIGLKTNGQDFKAVPYCASGIYGQGMHIWLLDQ